MTGKRRPRNVIAVTPGGELTLDHVMGFYVVSSIPDRGVSSAKLRKAWIGAGMDPALVPKTRKAVNAFQVACRSIETRRGNGNANGDHDSLKQVEVRVDEVLENAAECVYQVTHLVRDKSNRIIEHPKAMRVIFDKHKQAIRWEPLDQLVMDSDALEALGRAIQDHFDANANKVPGAKVRDAIRRTLEGLNGTPIAKGKLWFAPKAGRNSLEELREALASVYGDEDAYEFSTIPVANDEGQKKLVERHFSVNVTDECNRLIADITERLKNGSGVRSDRLRNMLEDKRRIEQQVEKYRDMLDLSLGQVDEQVLLLNEGLERLVTETGSAAVAAS